MAEIIYGSELSKELKDEMKETIEKYKAEGHRAPCLAVILVGNDPASESYVKGKDKACHAIGIDSKPIFLDASISQEELEKIITDLSNDDSVDGILLQLPLPKGLDEASAIQCIHPDKDVDGLHPVNFGYFFLNEPNFVPCTPLGIMELLKRMECDLDGKNAVVIGRSKLVGTPVARLLQNANATVTICHSHTKDLAAVCKQADVLIAAIGRPKMITKEYVKDGAYVIDVGVNRLDDGTLCGDVDFDDVFDTAYKITPVPKGVGPMTICMLLRNTLTSYERRVIQ